MKKLAIIGGGAAGYFCLANLVLTGAADNLSITLFEGLAAPMKKVLASGGGRCNVTNDISDIKELAKQFPRGEKFLYSVFSRFSARDTINWFESHNIELTNMPDGCVFPKSQKASDITHKLKQLSDHPNVTIRTATTVTNISQKDEKFILIANNKPVDADIVLIATGGMKSIDPRVKDYHGYDLAKKLGLKVNSPRLGLSSFVSNDKSLSSLAGVSLKDTTISLKTAKKKQIVEKGDLLFTHKGISGPPVINMSSKIADLEMSSSAPVTINVNFTRFDAEKDLEACILDLLATHTVKNIANIISELVPKSLATWILTKEGIDPDKKASVINKSERKQIVENLFALPIPVIGVNKYTAMVTVGGITLNQVDAKTMEAKSLPNLYLAGEILDVDGLCGGYNLQFAWSSAYIAAMAIKDKQE